MEGGAAICSMSASALLLITGSIKTVRCLAAFLVIGHKLSVDAFSHLIYVYPVRNLPRRKQSGHSKHPPTAGSLALCRHLSPVVPGTDRNSVREIGLRPLRKLGLKQDNCQRKEVRKSPAYERISNGRQV